jgi:hypothetical protein
MSESRGRRKHRPVGIGGPLILISLGVVFLLNNLGVWEVSVWELMFRFWPILLVAAGLDILLGHRSGWGSLAALALTLAILAGGVWLYLSDIRPEPTGDKISYSLGEVKQAQITIAPGMGDLRVDALSDSDNLVEGTLSGGNAEPEFTVRGTTASVIVESGTMIVGPFPDRWYWALGLSPEVPIDLNVDFGVGEAEVDLTGLDISDLDAHLAVGRGVLTLPSDGSFAGRIDGAIGELVIIIPEGMAAQISFDTGLAARQVPDRYDCVDDVCTSGNYSGADDKVDLEVHMAIGNVVIR